MTICHVRAGFSDWILINYVLDVLSHSVNIPTVVVAVNIPTVVVAALAIMIAHT